MSNHLKRVAQRPVAEIIVKLMPTGQVQVTGPLTKTALCTEMLRQAIKVVENFEKEMEKKIVAPEGKAIIEV